jgi:hypothetical protein
MEPNFNGTLNMGLKWNKTKKYDEKTKDSDLPCHTIDPRGRGWALWCSISRQGLSVGTVVAATIVLGWHSGVRVTYIDCSLLVATDVSQLIQKMIGIGWLRSADTYNLIFGIGYAMPVIRIILGYKAE